MLRSVQGAAASQGYQSMGPAVKYKREPDKTCLIGTHSSAQVWSAAHDGNMKKIRQYIGEGKDVEIQFGGMTPLTGALVRKHSDVALELIRAGANPNKRDSGGGTPLSQVCCQGNESLAATLIGMGVDLNAGSPLFLATRENHPKIAQMLLDAGADVNGIDPSVSSMTPLQIASAKNLTPIVTALISKRADLGIKYPGQSSPTVQTGDTALILATRNGHAGIVQLLVDARANVHEGNGAGHTAMKIARDKGNGGIAQILKNAGACEPSSAVQQSPQAAATGRAPAVATHSPSRNVVTHHPSPQHRFGMTPQQQWGQVDEEIKVAQDFVNLVTTVQQDFGGGGGSGW